MVDQGFGLRCIAFGLLGLIAACGGESDSRAAPAASIEAASTEATSSTREAPATTLPASERTPTSSVSSSAAPPTSAPATDPPSTTTTENKAVDPTIEEFRSPTGNIHCELTAEQARCSHHAETPWKVGGAVPRWAEGVSFGFTDVGCVTGEFVGFDVAASGRPTATCGDSLYTAPEVTLAYGERSTVGAISCLSQRFGMTCLNSNGNGFRMATNEIAMLYDRPPGWEAPSSTTADDELVPTATTTLDQQTKVATESGSTLCLLWSYDFLDPVIAYAECRPADGDMVYIGADWSPDGRSCAGADFNGYYLSDDIRVEAHRIATFGCTTDVSPLANPAVPAQSISQGEAVAIGGITCLSTGPAIACYNADGNGMLTASDEISFFYRRNV